MITKVENIDKEKKYKIINKKVYRIKKDRRLLVIKKHEFEGLLYMIYNHELSAHFGINAKEKYYWKNMFKDIKIYVKSCDKCQRRGRPIERNKLYLIKVKE
ncbi:hypothetical protein RclHR1_00130004 [Rhizophagus clarus]|nr:hypothetical protein RclHR1_00130004 [Rhizophagus clarus]